MRTVAKATQGTPNAPEHAATLASECTLNVERRTSEDDGWEDEEDEEGQTDAFMSPVVAEFPRKDSIGGEGRRFPDTSSVPSGFSRRMNERLMERRRGSVQSTSPLLTPLNTKIATPTTPTTSVGHKAQIPQRTPKHEYFSKMPHTSVWERYGRMCHTMLVVLGLSAPSDFRAGDEPTAPATPAPGDASQPATMTLWDHLMEEVLLTSNDSMQELKWERVSNFVAMPLWIEKLVWVGMLISFNSFLYMLTILPLRFCVAWIRWGYNTLTWIKSNKKRYLNVSNKCDILKGLLVVQTCYIFAHIADASKMYHSVRGQDIVKLSVIFSVLEISDRLCGSFGQDVLDTLFSRRTLARRPDGSHAYMRIIGYYTLCLAYIVFHTFVLLYQLVTLNVAINSYNNELLTLILSNQFVEIKTTVFKRFEKENLFQLACADIVERFQLSVILGIIGLRNLMELSGASVFSGAGVPGPLPKSFEVYPYVNVLFRTLNPVLAVLVSEMLVDWLKHAFIAKQNHIRPAIYGRFVDVLCRDVLPARSSLAMDGQMHCQSTFVDQSPMAIRRLGLAVLPLVCVLIRMASQIVHMLLLKDASPTHGALERASQTVVVLFGVLVVWIGLVLIKLLLGKYLVTYAVHRYATRQEREKEEHRNAKGRAPIGEMPFTIARDAQAVEIVDKREDNATSVGLYSQQAASARPPGKKEVSLLDVQRFSLVGSRLW